MRRGGATGPIVTAGAIAIGSRGSPALLRSGPRGFPALRRCELVGEFPAGPSALRPIPCTPFRPQISPSTSSLHFKDGDTEATELNSPVGAHRQNPK